MVEGLADAVRRYWGQEGAYFRSVFFCIPFPPAALNFSFTDEDAYVDAGLALRLPLGQDDARVFIAAEKHYGLESRAQGYTPDLDSELSEAVLMVSLPVRRVQYKYLTRISKCHIASLRKDPPQSRRSFGASTDRRGV